MPKGYSRDGITKLGGIERTLMFLSIVIVALSVAVKESAKVVMKYTGLDKQNFERKIVNIFLPISFNMCFG